MNKAFILLAIVFAPMAAQAECSCKSFTDHLAEFRTSDGTNGIEVCGVIDPENKTPNASYGLEVTACISGEDSLYFSEQVFCTFKKEKDRLQITEFTRLPFGKNSSWVDLPCNQYSFRFNKNKLEMKKSFVLVPPKYSETQIRQIVRKYEKLKSSLNGPEERDRRWRDENEHPIQDILGEMLACAMNGDKQARKIMPKMGKDLKVDGETGEIFSEITEIYRSYLDSLKNNN